MIEIKHRGRGPWPNLPIAPSYLAGISVLDMCTMVIRTTTEAVIIRDTAVDAPIGPRSPCAELGWTPGDASTIRAIRVEGKSPVDLLLSLVHGPLKP